MMEFSLSREGIAGVWGVWGDMGLPGDDEMDIEAGLTMLGTLVNWRLEELDERCSWIEEVIDSVRTLLVSRIC